MVGLIHKPNGSFAGRKPLPKDVRDDYGQIYGQRCEAKFYAPSGTKLGIAKQQFNEWLAEVEGRIATIRAQHRGEGISLTQRQVRGLAGKWYEWFIARDLGKDTQFLKHQSERLADALQDAGGEAWYRAGCEQRDGEPDRRDELWRADADLRKAVRPLLADVGETAQFLHSQNLVLDNETRDRFLDDLYFDLAAALKQLIRQSQGDYSPNNYAERFPNIQGTDSGETPEQLFARWVAEIVPARGTIESWQYVFRAMNEHFNRRSAASITPDEAQRWIKELVTNQRSARTVRRTWISASKAVFGWAVEQKYIPRNPFKDVKITIPKKHKLRETQAFLPQEYRTILRASLEIADTRKPFDAAKRWVPWLLAYTGARPGEITQLRKSDVIERDKIHALNLTPKAGSIKGGRARIVPLHEHLVAQGFLEFVERHREGPLFYEPSPKAQESNALAAKKPRSAQVRQRLADWIRSLGVDDQELQPNHAWRHTFKQLADSFGISERMSDSITGHAHKSVGAAYGEPTLEQKAAAMKNFSRYDVG